MTIDRIRLGRGSLSSFIAKEANLIAPSIVELALEAKRDYYKALKMKGLVHRLYANIASSYSERFGAISKAEAIATRMRILQKNEPQRAAGIEAAGEYSYVNRK